MTFGCGEETMIKKLSQLEVKDQKEKEERGMKAEGYQ